MSLLPVGAAQQRDAALALLSGPHLRGAQEVMRRSDASLASHISGCLPRDTYTAICVNTLSYCFPFSPHPAPLLSRSISLDVTPSQLTVGFFRALFSGLGVIEDVDDAALPIDQARAQRELVGSIFRIPDQNQDELRRAFRLCARLVLYISQDLSCCELIVEDSDLTRHTYQVAQFVADVAGPVVAAVGIVVLAAL